MPYVNTNYSGANYTPLGSTWNNNQFMNTYNQINDPLYPFVYGNPNGWGTNTNYNPFDWGKPGPIVSYCGCGVGLKMTQEGYCDSCGGLPGTTSNQQNNGSGYYEMSSVNYDNGDVDMEIIQNNNYVRKKEKDQEEEESKQAAEDEDEIDEDASNVSQTKRKRQQQRDLIALCQKDPSACKPPGGAESFAHPSQAQASPMVQSYCQATRGGKKLAF